MRILRCPFTKPSRFHASQGIDEGESETAIFETDRGPRVALESELVRWS